MGRTKQLAYKPKHVQHHVRKIEVSSKKTPDSRKRVRKPRLGLSKKAHMYEVHRAPRSALWKAVIKKFLPEAIKWHRTNRTGYYNKWVSANLTPLQCVKVMLHSFKCWFLVEGYEWKHGWGYNKNWQWWYMAIDRMDPFAQSVDWYFKKDGQMTTEYIKTIKDTAIDAFSMRMSVQGTIPQMECRGFDLFPVRTLANIIVETIPEFYTVKEE